MEKSTLWKRLFVSLIFGLMVSLGFAAAFSLIGIIVSYIGRGLLKYVGWFDLGIGILLVIIGFIYLFNLNSKINLNKLTIIGEKLKANKFKFKGSSLADTTLVINTPKDSMNNRRFR